MLTMSHEALLLPTHEEEDRLVFNGAQSTFRLTARGLSRDSDGNAINFEDCVGVRRDGTKLTYVSYPKVAHPASSCCATAVVERQRVETRVEAESEAVARKWQDVSFLFFGGENWTKRVFFYKM